MSMSLRRKKKLKTKKNLQYNEHKHKHIKGKGNLSLRASIDQKCNQIIIQLINHTSRNNESSATSGRKQDEKMFACLVALVR